MTDRNGNRIGVNDSVWVHIRDGADRPDRRLAVVRTIERSIAGNPIAGVEFTPHLPPTHGGCYFSDVLSCTSRMIELRD